MAPLVNKLTPLIYENIKEKVIEDITTTYNERINEIQNNLNEVISKLDYFESTVNEIVNNIENLETSTKEKLNELVTAIKSIYELISSIIHIGAKH